MTFRLRLVPIVLAALGASVCAQSSRDFPAADWPKADGKIYGRFMLVDMNLDGRLDAVTAHTTSEVAGVMLGDGLGGLLLSESAPTGVAAADDVTAGDLDEDGLPDAVVAHGVAKRLTVLPGVAGGNLGAPVAFLLSFSPVRLGIADFNLDGNLDVLSADATTTSLHIHPGNGAGGLGAAALVPIGGVVASARIGDANGDGRPDLLASLSSANEVSVALNGPGGIFGQPVGSPTPTAPNMLDLGDVDGDGDLDLALETGTSTLVTLLMGNGTAAFSAGTPVAFGHDVLNVRFGDCNGDDRLDLMVATRLEPPIAAPPTIAYAVAAAGSGFLPVVSCLACGDVSTTLRSGDLNGDGRCELVAAPMGVPALRVFLASPTGAPLGPQAVSQVLSGTWSVVSGDFDGDPWPDVAIGRLGSWGVSALRSDATGTVTFVSSLATPLPSSARRIAAGDFNGDGLDDLATVDTGDNLVATTLCLGSDAFGPLTVTTLLDVVRDVAAGDLDDDGDADLVLASQLLGAVLVLPSDGLGGWLSELLETLLGAGPSALALGDLDDDGELDAVTAGTFLGQGRLGRLLGGASLGFGSPAAFNVGGNALQDVALGDVDHDGDLDAFTLEDDQPQLFLSRNDGTGDFSAAVSLDTAAGPLKVAVGDVDGDGFADAVVSCLDADAISVFRGSAGGLQLGEAYAGAEDPAHVALADLAQDGLLDALVLGMQGDHLAVLRNQQVAPGVWADIGGALPGAQGVASLSGVGVLVPGAVGAIKLTNAAPLALSLFFVSIGSVPVPFKGGTLKAFPPLLMLPFFTDATGQLLLPYFVPDDFPSAVNLVVQVAIADAGGPQGAALSTALQVTTP